MNGLCLLNRLLGALLRRGMGSTFFFSGRPGAYASVIARLEGLAEASGHGDVPACLDRDILLLDLVTGERRLVRLRHPPQRRPAADVVSVFSPLGAALLEARPGQRVEVRLLGRVYRFRVIAAGDHPASESSPRGERRAVAAASRLGNADDGVASSTLA